VSAVTRCDWCQALAENDSDDLANWIKVNWSGHGSRRGGVDADYCTAACAVSGIEQARDEDAERLLASNEDDE